MEMQYYGLGFMTPISSVMKTVAARYPERWTPSAIPKEERSIWEDIEHGSLSADLISEHLSILLPSAQRDGVNWVERYCDFQEAKAFLRNALAEGKVCARFRDEWGRRYSLTTQFWESDKAEDAILRGEAWIPCQDNPREEALRVILVPDSELDGLLRGSDTRIGPTDQIHTCTTALDEISAKNFLENEVKRRADHNDNFNQKDAEKLIKAIDPHFDRSVIRNLFAEVKGSRERGRPSKSKN